MDPRRLRPCRTAAPAVLAALAFGLCAVPAATASQPVPQPRVGYAQTTQVCQPPAPGAMSCFAIARKPVSAASSDVAGVQSYRLDAGASSAGPAGGLTPSQLASAYGYDPAVGGAEQTVAVVDAYDDPSIEADLGAFDSHYGLPACTAGNGCLEKVGQSGSAGSLPAADTTGWSVEESLDVEIAHSACESCKVLLVEANSPTYKNLAAAVNEAVALGATEVSNSYGGAESAMGASEQAAYVHPGVVIAAATGDDGYDDWDLVDELKYIEGKWYFSRGPEMPNAPASLPSVVAVGGTTLQLEADGTRAGETVWNNNGAGDEVGLAEGFAQGATGGGCSKLFAAPQWQLGTPGFAAAGCAGKRLAADVSADANPLTGFDIYDSYDCGSYCEDHGLGEGWLTIGGTSLATPLISSLYALAGGGQGVSDPALTLYGHLGDPSSLYDVTEGANGFCGGESVSRCGDPNAFFGLVDCEGTTACNAAPGYDGPSGVGTPNGLTAFTPELPSAVITPPGSPKVNVPASFSAAGSSDPYPGGTIAGYTWSWGDGTANSSGVSPSHTFKTPGTYTVKLTVTDSYGFTSAAATAAVEVSAPSVSEEEATKKRHEEEAIAKKHEEEVSEHQREEVAKHKLQEEETAKHKLEEETAEKKLEEEAAKKKLEEAAVNKKLEEEVADLQQELAREQKLAEEAAKKKLEEEAAKALTPVSPAVEPPAKQAVAGFQAQAKPVPDATLVSASLTVDGSGVVKVKIDCPPGESVCDGRITLHGTGASAAARAPILTPASVGFDVPGGASRTVLLKLARGARELLSRVRTLRAKATLVAHDTSGATHTTTTPVTLRAGRQES